MKKVIITVTTFSVIVVACSKKSIPSVTQQASERIEQNTDTAKAKDDNEQAMAKETADRKPAAKESGEIDLAVMQGKAVFGAKCGKCHELKNPTAYTQAKWESILKVMAPKAKLTAEETSNVAAYVKAEARK